MKITSMLLVVAIIIAMLSSCKSQTDLGFETEEKSEEVIFTSVFISETTVPFTATEFYEVETTTEVYIPTEVSKETEKSLTTTTTITETTTSEITTNYEMSVKEMEGLPEIIFIYIYEPGNDSPIYGLEDRMQHVHFITNKGFVKNYTFEEDDVWIVPNSLHQQEFYDYTVERNKTITGYDYIIPKEDLAYYYELLQKVDVENNKLNSVFPEETYSPEEEGAVVSLPAMSIWHVWGIRFDAEGELEIFTINSKIDYNESISSDPSAFELSELLKTYWNFYEPWREENKPR